MTEINRLIHTELTRGCGQQGCQNRFCVSSAAFESGADDIEQYAVRLEAEYGAMALCLPSLRKISAIFKAMNQGMQLEEAWAEPPCDEVVVVEHAEFDILGMALTCNLSTIESLGFVLSDTDFTSRFFKQLLLVERNSYEKACQHGKIVKMENTLTKFIEKLIEAIFGSIYVQPEEGKIAVSTELLLKLMQLPDCLLERSSLPIACAAGIVSRLTAESKEDFVASLTGLLQTKGLLAASNPIISACNEYLSVKLADHDRPNHTISVFDLLQDAKEVGFVLELMRIYNEIYEQLLTSDRITIEDYALLKKQLCNDFINSNAYNITPDTNYWLKKSKTNERTDISVLPIELEFIMEERDADEYPVDMFSILDYAFVLNGGTKAQIFKYDVTMNIPHISELKVRREFIVEDTLSFLETLRKDWMAFESRAILRLPLKVVFDGEEGVDAGGLSNEFFSLIIEQLFHEKYNLFKFVSGANVYYFNKFPCLEEAELRKYYGFVGVILGLALINSVNINVAFPTCFFKLLLNTPLRLSDLAGLDPDLHDVLSEILCCTESDFEDTYCLDFSVGEQVFDEIVRVPLRGDGSEPVTLENKQEYVNLRWRYEIIVSVHAQFLALQEGFMQICDCASLDLLDAQDLQLMLCGEPNLDFTALRKIARYEEPYTANSQTIQWFWHIVLEYSEQEKSDFCEFVFGSRRAPAGGLGKARFEVHKNGEDDLRLPTSHTCFGILMLPQYSSEDVLREKLAVAIVNNEGFGLE